jgi:hypothetical protein
MMSWINHYKRAWRAIALALILAAMAGPWVFDRVHVPAQYPCDPPFVRLEGDFCGYPLSGMFAFSQIIGGLIQLIADLATGVTTFSERGRELRGIVLVTISLVLFVLPFFSTLRLIVSRDSQRRSLFHVIAWGVATALALLVTALDFHWAAWGKLLYTGLAISALTLEALVWARFQKTSRSFPETTAPS